MGLAIHEARQDGHLSTAPASAVLGNSPATPLSAWFPSEAPNPPGHRRNSELLQMRASKVCYTGLRRCISLFPLFYVLLLPLSQMLQFLEGSTPRR